jgi:hypothetical protein
VPSTLLHHLPPPVSEHDYDNVYVVIMEDVGDRSTPFEFNTGISYDVLSSYVLPSHVRLTTRVDTHGACIHI